MSIPLNQYFDREQLERRLNRDMADRIGELTDAAKVALVDTFCGDAAFDLDTNREPIILVGAERAIDNALGPLGPLQTNSVARAAADKSWRAARLIAVNSQGVTTNVE